MDADAVLVASLVSVVVDFVESPAGVEVVLVVEDALELRSACSEYAPDFGKLLGCWQSAFTIVPVKVLAFGSLDVADGRSA